MNENKNLMIKNENFFRKLLKRIKEFFKRNNKEKEYQINTKETEIKDTYQSNDNKKNEFFDSIKVKDDSGIIRLKIKLENNEIRAIDLTDEQIDELQKIYDKEIIEKQNKIKRLKGIA